MRIEIYINGIARKAWDISDDNYQDIDGATWEENVEARQDITDRYVSQFKSFVTPLFDEDPRIMFYLSFPSKANDLSDEMIDYLLEGEFEQKNTIA